MRLIPRFYFNTSLKKALIKIWGDLAKKKTTTKQNKTNHKTSEKQNKTSMHTKEVSINDGSGNGQMPKVHFCPLTSWKYIIKQRIFLFIRKSLVGQGLSCRVWQWQWQASEFPAGRWGKFKRHFLL